MTTKEKQQYRSNEELREVFNQIRGKKYRLDCGHHITFGVFLGNDLLVRNGKEFELICSECGR